MAGGREASHGDPWDERQYEMYPPALKSPYGERRQGGALQRARHCTLRLGGAPTGGHRHWNCFGAPAALFCYIDRDLGRPQWADVGMYLQTELRVFFGQNREDGLV
jgi:hypothetical protein